MGQHIGVYNKTKKQYVRAENEGAKLVEKMWSYENEVSTLRKLIALLTDKWAGDEIVVQGDYAEVGDPKFIPEEELKDYKTVAGPKTGKTARYFVGTVKPKGERKGYSAFLDTKDCPELYMMVLLSLYNSNGRGGGDIYYKKLVSLTKGSFGYVYGYKSSEDSLLDGCVEKLTDQFLLCDSFSFTNNLPDAGEGFLLDLTECAKIILFAGGILVDFKDKRIKALITKYKAKLKAVKKRLLEK